MPDAGSGSLRERYAAIAARLGQAATPDERDAMKNEIHALQQEVEQEIEQLTALQRDTGRLMERCRQLPAASSPTSIPAYPLERPVVVDRLGASTFTEKGWNLISLGDHTGAERALTRALELAPDEPQALSLLGWAQMLQEKYDEALLTFQKVLMRQPDNALARINVGYICLKKRIFGEAIEHLSRAIRLDNDRRATLYAHFYLGLVYAEREMYDDAQAFFRKALGLGPNLIEAHYELGRALWFGGKRDDALQAWREGNAANKFNPWGKRCGEMLKHVEEGGVPSRRS